MTTQAPFTLICDGIDENQRFKIDHTGRGEDLSPSFRLQNLPEQAQTLALVLRDESHPLFGSMTHWLIWNLPVADTIPSSIPHGTNPDIGQARQGLAYGWHRYRGPKPPKGKFPPLQLHRLRSQPISPTQPPTYLPPTPRSSQKQNPSHRQHPWFLRVNRSQHSRLYE
ncbi:hypothetical protein KIMH_07770 [Bombiscardovia apis]|uniref:YbhB/YbcL family Raf kinase inhibitor-like protein n=1 Tax=Bombiscardovia apis TaxID=2932182 RepID=A0ABM8BCM7_9BIFI|nr:hypothetical protein [Bombiscardovia apis]BDR54666.1 hypothetical protein KIMH_07770 [Bombiscardovia apis]